MSMPAVKAEAVRLRVEERKSLREIVKATGASQGIVSLWLRPYPLTKEEQATLRRQKRALQPNTPCAPRGPESHRHLMAPELGRDQKGAIAEMTVAARLAALGFLIYKPLMDGSRVDLLAFNPETLAYNRIQVKWVYSAKRGRPLIKLSCRDGRLRRTYTEKDIDFIIGYDLYSDSSYIWHITELVGLRTAVAISDSVKEKWDKLR